MIFTAPGDVQLILDGCTGFVELKFPNLTFLYRDLKYYFKGSEVEGTEVIVCPL